MNLEIQWFIYALVSNEIIDVDFCVQLYDQMGNPDLGTYAQTLLDTLAENMEQEECDNLFEQIQTVIDFAVAQAQTGEIPEIFAPEEPDFAIENLPSLENISSMNDQQVADLMCELLTSLRKLGASDMHISAMSFK